MGGVESHCSSKYSLRGLVQPIAAPAGFEPCEAGPMPPGQVAFHLPDRGVLIAGDALCSTTP